MSIDSKVGSAGQTRTFVPRPPQMAPLTPQRPGGHAHVAARPSPHLISPTYEYLEGWLFLNTYTWLLAMRSCAMSTFSLPFMTK